MRLWHQEASIGKKKIYFEHDDNYYNECIENLKEKGIDIENV